MEAVVIGAAEEVAVEVNPIHRLQIITVKINNQLAGNLTRKVLSMLIYLQMLHGRAPSTGGKDPELLIALTPTSANGSTSVLPEPPPPHE